MVQVHLRAAVAGGRHFRIGEVNIRNGNGLSSVRSFQEPFVIPCIAGRDGKTRPAAFLYRFGGGIFDNGWRPDGCGVLAVDRCSLAGILHVDFDGAVVEIGSHIRRDYIAVVSLDMNLNLIGLRIKSAFDSISGRVKPARAGDGQAGRAGGGRDCCGVKQRDRRWSDGGQNLVNHRVLR